MKVYKYNLIKMYEGEAIALQSLMDKCMSYSDYHVLEEKLDYVKKTLSLLYNERD